MSKDSTNNIKLALSFMKGYRLLYLLALAIMLTSAALFNAIPWFIMLIIDSVIGTKPFAVPQFLSVFIEGIGGRPWLSQNIWACGLFLVLISVVNGLLIFSKGFLITKVSESVGKKLRDRLFQHILNVRYEFFVTENAGDIIQRCSSDVENFQNFISGQLIELTNSILNVTAILTIMFLVNSLLAGISTILLPVMFFLTLISFKKMAPIWKAFEEAEAKMITAAQENISGVRVVKAFGAQGFEVKCFEESNSEFAKSLLRINKPMAIFWSVSDLVSLSQYCVLVIAGIIFAINSWITVGVFVSFLTYSFMLFWPVRHIAQLFVNMGQTAVATKRISEIFSHPLETDEPISTRPEINGAIEFKNVTLYYEGSEKPVLSNLTFKIEKGQTVGVLGATGSGKSSIANLLLRFHDYEGSITIDGTELKNIDRKWIRQKISVVLQEAFLFNKTIKENILFGDYFASDEKITASTKITAIHDSIESFENRYETILGERGVTLSGGQRQRLAIARTLLRDSSILVFDDSLSAVDMQTDAVIREELKKHRKDITKIFISHRITTLSNADLILVLEDGQISQKGTHAELLSQDGLYRRVCILQGLIEEGVAENV
ncbi:MAG: ABC transporter ATP-binding protein [Bacillota bacterium]